MPKKKALKNKEKNIKPSIKKKSRFSVFELRMPKQYYPRKQGNKSKKFAEKVKDVMRQLHDIELSLEFGLRTIKNFEAILFSKRRSSKRPIDFRYLLKLKVRIEDFDHEYENYCLRVYIYRETIWKFVAEFLDIRSRHFSSFLEDSKIRDIDLDKVLRRFEKMNDLKEIISFRNRITHKLKDKIEEKKLEEIIRKFSDDTRRVNRSLDKIIRINEDIAKKLSNYKKGKQKTKK